MVEVLKHVYPELVVLDYGGVVIDLFPERTRHAFREYGLNPDILYSTHHQHALFDALDKGQIAEKDFFSELKKMFPDPITVQELKNAWNAMLGTIAVEKIDFIRKLGKEIPVCLLSNTNEIHLQYIQDTVLPRTGRDNPEQWFQRVYYSCRLGMRKPEPEIFEFVRREWSCRPEKILFLDDTEIHIRAAASMGWKAIKINTNENWIPSLNSLLT